MIDSAETLSFSRRFDLWYTRNVSQVSEWPKRTSIFYHQYSLMVIVGWLVHCIFQKCLWAFVHLSSFFRCRAFQEVSTCKYIPLEVRQDLFVQLYEPTYDMLIWYLHRSHTCAQGKNSLIVARHNHLNNFVWCMIPKFFRYFIWCWFWFVVCSLNVVFKLKNVVFILKSHSRCVF